MKKGLFSFFFLFALLVSAQEKKDTSAVYKKAGVGVELALNTCFGGTSNNSGNAVLSNLSYESAINLVANEDTIAYSIGGGIAAGFDLNLMFGKKRNVGFSVGAMVVAGFNSFTLNDFEAEYKATDAEGRSFKRIISASQWKEKITYTNISVPVLFKFRHYWKKKVGVFADIGPVISVLSNAKSLVDAVVDFEAVYSMEGGIPHYSEQSQNTDWLITRDMIEKHTNANVNDYFDQQYSRGYFVGLNKSISGDAPIVNYKIGFGGLLRAGMTYEVSKVFSIALGAQCLVVSNPRKTSSAYKPIDISDDFKQTQKINTILNSTGSLLKAQYGLHIGLYVKLTK